MWEAATMRRWGWTALSDAESEGMRQVQALILSKLCKMNAKAKLF